MKANFCFLQHFKNLIRYSVGDVLTLMMWDFSGFNQIKLLGLYCSWQTETVMKCYFNLELLAKRWKYVQRRKMCEMAIMHKYFSQNDQQSLWADTYLHTKHVHSICFTNFSSFDQFSRWQHSENLERSCESRKWATLNVYCLKCNHCSAQRRVKFVFIYNDVN